MITDTMSRAWQTRAVGVALIVLMTTAAYLPAMRGGFLWDDDVYVTENPALRSRDGLRKIWAEPGVTSQYYPLTLTSFWVEYRLWGLRPFGYHLVNVLLHATNAVLLWRVVRALQLPGAWWIAAVFALHPVMVESVAWITERKNVLSGFFYLLAVLAYFRFRPLTGERPPDWRLYPVVVALFVCALWSKTVTCSLPAALALLTWWKSGRLDRRDAVALAPLFAIGAAMGLVTVWVEKHIAGATGAEWALSFGQRCLLAGRAVWFYAGKLVWPAHLAFIYPRWNLDTAAAWQYTFPAGALAVLAGLWVAQRRIGRGPAVAGLFFVGTLMPALGFFDVYPFRYSFVADHFQYLAGIGPIALVIGAVTSFARKAGAPARHGACVAGGVLLLTLGISTWKQAHIYRDLETLWRDTLRKNPGAWLAHSNLGVVLHNQGETGEAVLHYEQAARSRPDLPELHYNLGNALAELGRLDAAISRYRQALQIKPDYVDARNNLGVALARAGRVDEALAQWEQALRVAPDLAEAHDNLGKALAMQGRAAEAIAHFRRALDSARRQGDTGLAARVEARIAAWETNRAPDENR